MPAVFSEAAGRRFIERQWSRARQGTGYSFAIADAATDRAVGQAGLWLHDIGDGRASVGYWVGRAARGRRAAACSVTAISRWAFTDLRNPTARALRRAVERGVDPDRGGGRFSREGLLRSWQPVGGQRRDMFMYSLLPSDPAARGRPS